MEALGRAMNAMVVSNTKIYVNWRLLYSDPKNVAFNLYRSTNGATPEKLNTNPISATTDYSDASVTVSANSYTYTTKPVSNGAEGMASAPVTIGKASPIRQYLPIPLKTLGDPLFKTLHVYVGDLDGDGELDYVVKRMKGDTLSTIMLDAYKNNGTFLWRIDLGPNIEKGNSSATSPVLVYDFDGDGKAEVFAKTGEGTKFGNGITIGDTNKDGKTDYRASAFWIYNVLSGPEFVSVINGLTGAEISRDNFMPRGKDTGTDFGDSYGHRMNFIFVTVAYLDGLHPSIVMSRGPGDYMKVQAWDFAANKLTKRWAWNNLHGVGLPTNVGYADFHAVRALDLDADGKDEISWGGFALNDDGKILYGTLLGHGDRFQIADIDPNRPGFETYAIQQNSAALLGAVLYDAQTGVIFKKFMTASVIDAARGEAMDLDPSFPGMEVWSTFGGLRSALGDSIAPLPNTPPLGIWWDGDLQREMLMGIGSTGMSPGIDKYNPVTKTAGRIFSMYSSGGAYSSTITYGGRPQLYGDLFGDWREEVVTENSSADSLRIYTTTIPAQQRIPSLIQDPSYRNCVNVKGYLQSTNLSYFLGTGMKLDSIPGWQDVLEPVGLIAPPKQMRPGTIQGNTHEGFWSAKSRNGKTFRLNGKVSGD
jgi:rhamnogalacturonan endolyase